MKEIGSEFWDIPTTETINNSLLQHNVSWYLSGRSALNAILDDICSSNKLKTAALPSWCCDSMIKPFLSHGLSVKFYSVYLDENRHLVQEIDSIHADVKLVMDYFGFKNCPKYIKDSIVIRDITHSIFNNNDDHFADYVFGSLRKWTGFCTGGFAWSNVSELAALPYAFDSLEYISLRKKAMEMKKSFINYSIGDKSFLPMFSQAEEWLDRNETTYGSTELDYNAFKYLDIDYIKMKRRENANHLLNRLHRFSFVEAIYDDDCPLFVPLFLESKKRDGLRKFLIENRIYCPIHWGVSEYHELKDIEKRVYDEELSIICDQRYDVKEMYYIADKIEEYLR